MAAAFPPAQAHAASGGCAWAGETDQRDVNVGAPDLDAFYWMSPLPAVAGTRVVVSGDYPQARYFSFHVYNPQGAALGSIYDQQINPDRGSSNPYRHTPTAGSARRYTVDVVYGPKPAHPAPNTLYAPLSVAGRSSPAGLLVYRVYVPRNPSDPAGGPYPKVTVNAASGGALYTESSCAITPPPAGSAVWAQDAGANYPLDSPHPAPQPSAARPTWQRAFGSQLGNQQNAYLVADISRRNGDLVVIHTRAPTFPNTRAGQPVYGHHQLRYWSFCTYDQSGQAAIGCAADYAAQVRRGEITYVVSDPADRPANAIARNGVTWLPWGGADADTQVVYRNMLPAADFRHAAQRITPSGSAARVMGPYYPTAVYCSRSTFERGGWSACFGAARGAACHARRLGGARGTLRRGTLIDFARLVHRRHRALLRIRLAAAARLNVTYRSRGRVHRLTRRLRPCRVDDIVLPAGHGPVRVIARAGKAHESRTLRM